jgi:acyl-CoA thioesterase YciA
MKLISTKICKTGDIGVNDNLFGGIMLSWLDEAGGIMAANACCDHNVITLKMDEVLFKHAVKVKEQIRIYGKVERIGRTSVSLYLEARRANLLSGEEEVVCSTKMVFVRVDNKGKPVPIKKC